MINVEKLLGKVISEMTGSHHGSHDYKKKYKDHHKKKSDDLVSGLVGNLVSGKGLMTAIGLGVGAYTIFQDKAKDKTAQPYTPPPPQPTAGTPNPAEPAPPRVTPPPLPPKVATVEQSTPESSPANEGEVARRMIQVMVSAAHADGHLDQEEESKILGHLRSAGLSQEEKNFILAEIHHPRTIEEISQGMNDPKVNLTMYSLAVATIHIDTEQERIWLDNLAGALSISKEMQRFIEE